MCFPRTTRRIPGFVMALILSVGLLFSACSDNPAGNDDNGTPSGPLQVEGSANNPSNSEQELYQKEDFVDLIEGSIQADGSFTVEFLGEDAISEALKPLGDDHSDNFVGMYCRDEVSQSLEGSPEFVDVNLFNFTYGEDTNVMQIALSSDSPNGNVFPPQSDTDGDHQARWIYASQDVSVDVTCSEAAVDVELNQGWNEVYFDISDRDNKMQYTGDRPGQLDWVTDEF